jgi:hypothetical protein
MIRCLCFALFLSLTLGLGAEPWTEDWAQARQTALSSGKPLLVKITGSDWCLPGQLMESEVYDLPAFQTAADKFVLVRLDFPHNSTQAERWRVQNREWVARNPVDSLPTFFVLDAQGTVLGRWTGVVDGGVPAFLTLTQTFVDRAPALAALMKAVVQSAAGTDRARAQDALFRQAEAWDLTAQYGDLPLKIVQEDKEGKAGLKARYQVYNAYQRFLASWSESGDFRRSVTELDQLATRAQPWPELQQKIVFTKGMVLLNALDDELAARDAFRSARGLGVETATGQQAARLLDTLP